MNKTKLTLSALTAFLLSSGVYAGPVTLSLAQMDTVAGGAFVCPVISTDAIKNSNLHFVNLGDGYYSIVPDTDITVPVHATNDNGTGSPGGNFVSPGNTSYTAIWY